MEKVSVFEIQGGILKKYTGPGGDVVIPEDVKVVDYFSFYECSGLASVTLPDSVTNIGNWAFRECSNLRSVRMSPGVTNIGNSAFYGCSNLTDITIPGRVTEISHATFYGCLKLQNIRIPEGVTTIGRSAFARCSALTDITLPASVTNIGSSAFSWCFKLTEISILGQIGWIGEGAFDLCDALAVIYAPKTPIERFREQKLAMPAVMGYIQNSGAYTDPQIAEGYQKFLFAQKKKLLPFIFQQDLVQVIELFARAGKIPAKEFDEIFMQPAQAANATQCVAFLLDWKGKHIPAGYAERQLLRELEKDPYNITDMKKFWNFEQKGNALTVTGYKGTDAEVEIPPRIGALPVTAIAAEAFSTEKSGRRQTRRAVLEKLVSVTIPACVTYIGTNALSGCNGVTVYAPPGSCAEVYAKRNGIPFAATDTEN